ncbi:MAG: hypothetical protein ACYDCC_16425 [Actinomycetota bacterium]
MNKRQASNELRTLYEQRLTVRHVAIFDLECTSPNEDALVLQKAMIEKDFHIMPVEDHGAIEAYVLRDELTQGPVRDFLRPLGIHDLVAESMPLLDAMALFKDRTWFFVMAGSGVDGIVTLADMRRPPVQMFLFALVSLLESKMARLIRYFEPDSWNTMISEKRLLMARTLLEERQARGVSLDLVDCLQMCDKRTVAEKSPKIQEALRMQRVQVTDFLKRVEDLRNELAHAQDFLAHRQWREILLLVDEIEQSLDAFEGTWTLDFSDVPSDLALGLAQHDKTEDLVNSLARTLGLDHVGRDMLHDVVVGGLAQSLDEFLHYEEKRP